MSHTVSPMRAIAMAMSTTTDMGVQGSATRIDNKEGIRGTIPQRCRHDLLMRDEDQG